MNERCADISSNNLQKKSEIKSQKNSEPGIFKKSLIKRSKSRENAARPSNKFYFFVSAPIY